MISRYFRAALMVVALGAFVSVPMVNAYPTPAGNVSHAIDHVKQAVAHGKEGHVDELVKHAETALDFAEMGGKDLEVREGIHHLKEALAHIKAGHADVGIEHIETALKHLSEFN
ncbi:MAG: metal-binding protein SmbP [Nitrospira sp.]|nr:metal-binding protein SmbP [Nitrospira sp.]